MHGPVDELYIACRRRELKRILDVVKEEDPDAFYITEMPHGAGCARTCPVPYIPLNGRRLFLKRR
jgi:hypothetical protein